MRVRVTAFLLALVAIVVAPPATAPAIDPGRWVETGYSPVPLEYFQGVTSDRQRNLFFDGLFTGLYRTDRQLNEEARNDNVIPLDLFTSVGYNHIGDITWDRREGGRVLLPLECFLYGPLCKTGAVGVADPVILQWRYYVQLDPTFIDKAMWAEASPNGKLLWTSSGSGDDLLAYDMDEITAANAAPDGPRLRPVRVLEGAVPPLGITGATFHKHRLLLASGRGSLFQVWSVDLTDGSRELEIEKTVFGESEGLDIVKTLGGDLHWLITPFQAGGRPPTYGSTSALVHFVPAKGRFKP
jgi:hypothetical protein